MSVGRVKSIQLEFFKLNHDEWINSLIFVTGGTGFLGRHLLPVLCRAGYRVRVLTRHPEQHPWLARYPNVETVVGDLRDRQILQQALIGCRYLIHAGGLFRFWGIPVNLMRSTP